MSGGTLREAEGEAAPDEPAPLESDGPSALRCRFEMTRRVTPNVIGRRSIGGLVGQPDLHLVQLGDINRLAVADR